MRETRIKRHTYTPRLNDNIFGHWYTHSITKGERETQVKWRTYARRISGNIRGY